MIAKICDICGRMYEPYGSIIDQEEDTTATGDPIEIDEDNLADADYDFTATGEEAEINGLRPLTIDPYGSVQYNHEMMDLCTTCRDMIIKLENAISNHEHPDRITDVSFTFTVNNS